MSLTVSNLDLTIVIVNWNGGELLMQCLESIRTHAPGVSVIVVDNDSADGSREAATQSFPEFRVVNSGSNLGFGRANNLARSLVETSLVLFLNPDTELLDGSLDRAAKCLKDHPDVGVVGCRMHSPEGKVQELGLQWSMTPWTAFLELLFVTERTRRHFRRWLPVEDPHKSAYVRKLYGGFIMVRREVLERADWFDERYFMYAEDADLSRTVLHLGWKLFYCSEAVITHVGGGVTESASSAFSILMKQESINKMIAKYDGSAMALLHRTAVFFGSLLRLGAAFVALLIAGATRNAGLGAFWKTACRKYEQSILWSLDLRRATVPGSVPRATRLRERRIG